MFRESLFAVFRRRNSARYLNKVKVEIEKDCVEGNKDSDERDESLEEEEKPRHESTNSLCLYEKVEEEAKEELELVEEAVEPRSERVLSRESPEEIEERFSYSLKANPIFEEEYSDCELQLSDGCEQSVASEVTEGTDAVFKDDGLLFVEDNIENPKKPKSWTSQSKIGLGWTPGRIRRVENRNVFVLEPVVALTDALDDICLDENLIRAMSGKRGSFSSEISVRTDESEGSEAKRVRMWSVFRSRGGSGPPS